MRVRRATGTLAESALGPSGLRLKPTASVDPWSREAEKNEEIPSIRPCAHAQFRPRRFLFSSPAFRAACHVLRDRLPGVENRDGRSGPSGSTRSFPRPRSFFYKRNTERNPRCGIRTLGLASVFLLLNRAGMALIESNRTGRAARPDLQSG
jgi:hypothetical protein